MGFSDLKIGSKMLVGFVSVALIAVVIGVVGIMNIRKIDAADTLLYEKMTLPLAYIGEASVKFQRIRVNLRDMIEAHDAATVDKDYEVVKKLQEEIHAVEEKYKETILTEAGREAFAKYEAGLEDYAKCFEDIYQLSRANDDERAIEEMAAYKEKALYVQEELDALTLNKENLAKETADNNTKTANAATLLVIIFTVVGGILAIGLGLFISRQIVNPINAVVNMIKDIAQGEGDLTKRIDVTSEDEVGALGNWFNTFVDKVHDIIAQVASTTAQVSSASQQLSATSEEMASGAEEQTSQTSQVATSVEEMSATVQQVAKNANVAATSAKDSGNTAKKGGEIVQETVNGMNRINGAVSELQTVIKALSQGSEKIGNIIGVIDDVADQTNLLALNAAIEAARAGEQGRGFAVVADEVRKLAERTTTSTKEIAEMVKVIQEDTGKAVSSMETGSKEVASGVKLAEQAGVSLKEIVAGVQSMQDMIQQIATAAEEQSAAAEEISSNVESIASVAKQRAAGTQQAASAAQDLSQLSEGLQNLVNQFKLKEGAVKHVEKKAARQEAHKVAAPPREVIKPAAKKEKEAHKKADQVENAA